MLGLVAAVQLASSLSVYLAVRKDVAARAGAELDVGRHVFDRFLQERATRLDGTVQVLASDFGFKQAVASGDRDTIRSVLFNHGARVDADLAMLVLPDGTLMATTLDQPVPGNRFPFSTLLGRMTTEGNASAIVPFRGRIYQMVAVPVYAPLPIGWVCMGFVLDDAVARDVKGLTSLDVSFVSEAHGQPEHTLFSTLNAMQQAALKSQWGRLQQSVGSVLPLDLGDGDYLTLNEPLADDADSKASAVLQGSLSAAYVPYRNMLAQLTGVTLLALLVALVMALVLSRTLSRPLALLADAVGRVGSGDYSRPVSVEARDETAELATAFNNMQEGIAEREERIAFQAYHDVLTGLPNRGAIQEELQAAIQTAGGGSLAVLMLDLSRFKEINDTLGHHTGDKVLLEVAQRLKSLTRTSDAVGRLGGDEFLMVLKQTDAEAAGGMAARILAGMQTAIRIADVEIDMHVNIGIAMYPDHGTDPETLTRRADIAMYDAKQENLPWRLYESGRDERYLKRLELISDLRHAAERNELWLAYQPKIDVQSRRADGVEALLRWQHPRLGLVPPDEFIPLAEQSGNIRHITEWVLRRVIAQCREWAQEGWQPMVSVNLSALDLVNNNLPVQIGEWLALSGVPASQLVLEITESAVMRDAVYAGQVLQRLKNVGVRLSIDDFGTGYSSLAQLKRMPVDELKIDKSFLLQLKDGSDDAVIVKSTIELAHNIGLSVIAEGVETDECMSFLRNHRCDQAQGYFFSPPLTADKLRQWLAAYQRSKSA
jgi:diguanylate cyclase (GGDEF)-like protein